MSMNLLIIFAATLIAGVGSVWLAFLVMKWTQGGESARVDHRGLLSLAAGALLATAFMHLLPEAFESGLEPSLLFAVLLGCLVFFFLLDKAELWHHGHEHPAAHQEHAPNSARSGGWAVLTGDSVHCFGDGVLIASALMADLRLGLLAAIAVLVHEVPHHIGDLVVLKQSSSSNSGAMAKVSLAGAMTTLGGIAGWWLVGQPHSVLPYLLVVASGSFVYVALADLVPQLQTRSSVRQTGRQIAWLVTGIVLVTLVSHLAHEHEHEQEHEHASTAAPLSSLMPRAATL